MPCTSRNQQPHVLEKSKMKVAFLKYVIALKLKWSRKFSSNCRITLHSKIISISHFPTNYFHSTYFSESLFHFNAFLLNIKISALPNIYIYNGCAILLALNCIINLISFDRNTSINKRNLEQTMKLFCSDIFF